MIPANQFVDHFMLKLAERKAVTYITEQLAVQSNKCTLRQRKVKSEIIFANCLQVLIILVTSVIMYSPETRQIAAE